MIYTLQDFLPVVIYFLLIILLIVGIILGIKAIEALSATFSRIFLKNKKKKKENE